MLVALAGLVGLGSFVCFIMVLIKQFQDAGPMHGIIGIVTCGLWTLIWGWMNSTRLGIKNLMMAWTGLIVLTIVLQVVGVGAALSGMSSSPSM
jgi:hypothetical protein